MTQRADSHRSPPAGRFDPRFATTFLFVPGDRPERFGRAASSGTEIVVIDLEDGVSPEARRAARRHAVSWLRSGHLAVVRVNARGTGDHALDTQALRDVATHVMLSKTESAAEVAATVAEFDSGVEVIALVETARGVTEAGTIASADAVIRLAFGNVDLSTDLGVDAEDRQALQAARSLLTLASAAAGIHGPVDGVTTSFVDIDLVLADASHAASLGFRGKLCIHPSQIAAAKAGFVPSQAQVSWAQQVLAAPTGGQARAVDGAMVDRPVEERARDILRRAATAD